MYKVLDRDLLNIRNNLFLKHAVPHLEKNGFQKAPFSGVTYGRDNLKDFTYELVRLTKDGHLEMLTVFIIRGGARIQFYLNIFELSPKLVKIDDLESLDGLEFYLPPNNGTRMELRDDDYRGIPLFYLLFCPAHKIGFYLSKSGFDRQVQKLERLISRDMEHIDASIKRWHQLHTPARTDWEGNRIDDPITETKPKTVVNRTPNKVSKKVVSVDDVELLETGSVLYPDLEAEYKSFVGAYQEGRKSFLADNTALLSSYDYFDLPNLTSFEVLFIFGDKEGQIYTVDWRGEENEREVEEFIEAKLGIQIVWDQVEQLRTEVGEDDQTDGKFIVSLFKCIDQDLERINKKLLFFEFHSDSYQFSVVDRDTFDLLSSKFGQYFHGSEKLK